MSRRLSVLSAALGGLTLVLVILTLASTPSTPIPRPKPIHISTAPVSTKLIQPSLSNTTNTTTPRPSPSKLEGPKPLMVKDIYQSGFSRAHSEKCPLLGSHLKLLILVTSAPAHRVQRETVRLTWGHFALRKDVSLLFVIGAIPKENTELNKAIDTEDLIYGDIIQGVNLDTYSNLTLKTLSMLEWADTFCPKAHRLLKADDDVFVNVPQLMTFLDSRAEATNTIWGKVVRKWLPKRTTKSKYYVSPLQYPQKVFPEFATGPAYVMTKDCIPKLLKAASQERYLRLEDVFLTGVCALRAGIQRKGAAQFVNRAAKPSRCQLRKSIAIHMVDRKQHLAFWKDLNDDVKC